MSFNFSLKTGAYWPYNLSQSTAPLNRWGVHMRSSRLRAVLLGLFAAAAANAQLAGRLTGTVVDPATAPIPNAKVSLYLLDGKTAVHTTTTDAEGNFQFVAIRPERY